MSNGHSVGIFLVFESRLESFISNAFKTAHILLQLWRIVSNFFGPFGFASLFNILFAYRYSRMLEENSFRGRTADLCFMFLFGAACMIVSFDCGVDLII